MAKPNDKSKSNANGAAHFHLEATLWTATRNKLGRNLDVAAYRDVVLGLLFFKSHLDGDETGFHAFGNLRMHRIVTEQILKTCDCFGKLKGLFAH